MSIVTQVSLPIVSITTLIAMSATGCSCGGIDPNVDTVNTNETVAGDSNSNTTVDDVAVEEANVDADTDVNNDVDVDADAETNVEDSGNIDVEVNIGGGDDDGDIDDDDASGGEENGGASSRGDGMTLESSYQGPINERVDLVPGFDDELIGMIDSVEWIVRGPVLGTPTIFDDEDGFAWGAPQLDNDDDALDEYTLAVRFGEDTRTAFAWTTESAWCIDGTCDGRAVSAACMATIVLRAWLVDGTSREVAVAHESERPTCWE